MKKFSIATVIDSLFTAFISFLLAFVLFNYFTPKPYSYALSACVAALVALFTLRRLLIKFKKSADAAEEEKKKNDALNQLDFSAKPKVVYLFEKALKKSGIISEKKNGGLYLPEKKIFAHFAFGFDGATKKDIVKAFNSIKEGDVAHVFATRFPPEVRVFAARFNGAVILKDGNDVYKFLKENNSLPEITCVLSDGKPQKKNLFKEIFKKKKAKSFCAFGVMFLIMSFFVPFKLYYVIFGTALILLSVVCRIYGKKEENGIY